MEGARIKVSPQREEKGGGNGGTYLKTRDFLERREVSSGNEAHNFWVPEIKVTDPGLGPGFHFLLSLPSRGPALQSISLLPCSFPAFQYFHSVYAMLSLMVLRNI